MPKFREDLQSIQIYRPGKPIEEVSRELGITEIVKLASNESPLPPFPEVTEAISAAASSLNRYPENSAHLLVNALADRFGLTPDHFWVGAGSTELLAGIALATGGPGTSAVYADPSFVMYPIGTAMAGATGIPVPLDDAMRLDLDAMAAAVRPDTTVVYVCNPNNPTGTHRPHADVTAFIRAVSDEVLVVVDEAYFDYVTAPDYASALDLALERDNVVALRTFSKVYGLAGLRVGYAIGNPATLAMARRTQRPFSVNSLAQVAAVSALAHSDRLDERVKANAIGRDDLESALSERGLDYAPSQANFVMFRPAGDAAALADRILRQGVIVRRLGDLIRVTVGTEAENARFVAALDAVGDGRRV